MAEQSEPAPNDDVIDAAGDATGEDVATGVTATEENPPADEVVTGEVIDADSASVARTIPTAPDMPSFERESNGNASELSMLKDVTLHVKIELGRTRMYIEDVLKLNENSVVELDKAAGDPVDIFVNDRLIARGEVLVLDDNFCVRISEIVAPLKKE